MVYDLLELSFGLTEVFNEVCAVVLNKNSVQVLGFIGQTVM